MPKKKENENENIPRALGEWYQDIAKLFFFYKNNSANTTFLQIFFKPALYCEKIVNALMNEFPQKSREEYENAFYAALKDKFVLKTAKSAIGISKSITNTLSLNIIASGFCDSTVPEGLVSEANCRLKDDYQAYMYKKEFIRTQYKNHPDFYIPFIADILKAMHSLNCVNDMDILVYEICQLTTKRSNTYNSSDKYQNTAHHLYKLILYKANSQYYPDVSNEPDTLSRLTNEADPSIRQDSYEYLSVCEYFPIGTIERLGAMEMISKKNIYACQELYFFYQNDNLLYNITGTKKFFIKKDLNRAEKHYQNLVTHNANMLSSYLRHDINKINENYPVAKFQEQRIEYESGRLNQTEKKNIIDSIFSAHSDTSVPFNIELVWFLKKALDECPNKDQIHISNKIEKLLLDNPWIRGIMDSPPEEPELQLTDILFDFIHYKKIKNRDFITNICLELSKSDIDKLKQYREMAKKNIFYFEDLQMEADDSTENELDMYINDWREVFDIIKQTIQQIKKTKN